MVRMAGRLAAMTVAVLLVQGCTSVARSPEAPATARGAGPGGVSSEAAFAPTDNVRVALLTEDDLPTGFVPADAFEKSPAPPAGTSGDNGGITGSGVRPDRLGCLQPAPTAPAVSTADASFAKSTAGPYIQHRITRVRPGDAATVMTGLAAVRKQCGAAVQEFGPLRVRFAAEDLPVAGIGRSAVAFRLVGTAEPANVKVVIEFVAVRSHDVVTAISHFALTSTQPGVTGQLARRAAERCAARVTGC